MAATPIGFCGEPPGITSAAACGSPCGSTPAASQAGLIYLPSMKAVPAPLHAEAADADRIAKRLAGPDEVDRGARSSGVDHDGAGQIAVPYRD